MGVAKEVNNNKVPSLISLRCPYNNKSHLPQKIVARQECSSRMQKSKLKLVESKYVTIKNRTHKKSTKAFSILVWVLVLVLLAWSFQNNDLLPSGSVYAFTISNVIIDLDGSLFSILATYNS